MNAPTGWYENDDFWTGIRPFIFGEERMVAAIGEVDSLIHLLDLSPGSRVLDLCCGVGRHVLEFARRGHRPVGVDRTASYLDEARRQAAAQGLEAEFVHSDVRDFVGEGFDAAINMYTSFGYFDDPEDDLRLAQVACRSLKPGGRFHVQGLGKEVIAAKYRATHWEETEPGVFWLEEARIGHEFSHVETRWVRASSGNVQEIRFRVRMYSGAELRELLLRAGFDSVALYGDLDGRPYDREAKRLHAVAQKL